VNGVFDASHYGGTGPLAALNDGRLIYQVAGGYSRATADGLPDASFGSGGVQAWPAGYAPEIYSAWERTSDGKPVQVLRRPGSDGTEFAVMRLGLDGQPDPTFGANGVAVIEIPADGSRDAYLAVQPNGKILVLLARHAPDDWYYYDRLLLVRLLQDGTPDPSFGILGTASITTDLIEWMDGTGVTQRGDGLIEVHANPVACVEDDATADSCASAPGASTWRIAALMPDGGSLATLISPGGGSIARLLSDGSFDDCFGANGDGTVDLSAYGAVFQILSSTDGSHAYVGTAQYSGGAYRHRLLRVNAMCGSSAGSLDTTFGASGILDFKFTSFGGTALGVADGSAIVTGGPYAYRLLGGPGPSPGVVGISDKVDINSSAGTATLRVQRVAGSDGAVTVHYRMPAVSDLPTGPTYATAGVDYDAVSGDLEWTDGDDGDKLIEIPLHLNSYATTTYLTMVVDLEVTAGNSLLVPTSLAFSADFGQQVSPSSGGGGGNAGGGNHGGGSFDWLALVLLWPAIWRRLMNKSDSTWAPATSRNAA
jgi:uncharacterized delta-60 repeat protein